MKGLTDVQAQEDIRGLPVWAGVDNVRKLRHLSTKAGDRVPVVGTFTALGLVPMDRRGAHMSRFIEVLDKYDSCSDMFPGAAQYIRSVDEELLGSYVSMRAEYPIETSLFPIEIATATIRRSSYELLSVSVPVITVCPCAKETTQNHTSHMQRAVVSVSLSCYGSQPFSMCSPLRFMFEDIVEVVQSAGSASPLELLKRPAEASLVEEAYSNPKFVEDVVRDAVNGLVGFCRSEFCISVSVRGYESIHTHDAVSFSGGGAGFCLDNPFQVCQNIRSLVG